MNMTINVVPPNVGLTLDEAVAETGFFQSLNQTHYFLLVGANRMWTAIGLHHDRTYLYPMNNRQSDFVQHHRWQKVSGTIKIA